MTPFKKDFISSIDSESRHAWLLVVALAFVFCVSFGLTINVLGLFTPPIMASFGSSTGQASQISTVFFIAMTLTMPASGWLLDRIPPRSIMVTGVALTALGYLLASQSPDLESLTLCMVLCGVGVGASTYVPGVTLVTHWVSTRRQGLAFGILMAGASLGGIVFPLMVNSIMTALGWRTTMQVLAATIFLTCSPPLFLLARMPETHGAAKLSTTNEPGAGIGQALGMSRYWLWIAMMTFATLSYLGIYMSLASFLIAAGYSDRHAAAFLTACAISALAGNFLFGTLSARWGAYTILMIGTACNITGILFLLAASHPSLGLAAVVLFSILWGSTFNLSNQFSPLLLIDAMGSRNFGSLLGIGNLVAGLGSAFGPMIVGYLADATKTYTLAMLLCAGLMAVALGPITLLHRLRKHQESTPALSPA